MRSERPWIEAGALSGLMERRNAAKVQRREPLPGGVITGLKRLRDSGGRTAGERVGKRTLYGSMQGEPYEALESADLVVAR